MSDEHVIHLDGIEIYASRSVIDGVFLIQVNTEEAKYKDMFHTGVPRIRLGINDDYEELNEDGQWVMGE